MKKKSYTLFTYALAILLGVALFLTSERVQRAERLYNDIQENLVIERESYHILQTEWTYLNRPDRLEDLTETHLKLVPLKPETTLISTVSLPVLIEKKVEKSEIKILAEMPGIKSLAAPAVSEPAARTISEALNSIEAAAGTSPITDAPTTADTDVKILKVSTKTKIYSPKKQTPIRQKQTESNRNTSTTAVTFYQYMNRPSGSYPKVRGQ